MWNLRIFCLVILFPYLSESQKCKKDRSKLTAATIASLRALWEERWFHDTSKFPKVKLTPAQQLWWCSLADYFPQGRITSAGGNVDQTHRNIAAQLLEWKQAWFDSDDNPDACLTPKQKSECEKQDNTSSGKKKRDVTTPEYTTIGTLSPEEIKAIEEASKLFGDSWLVADPEKFPATNLTALQKLYLDGIKIKYKNREKERNKPKRGRDCVNLILPAWTRMEWRRMAKPMRDSFLHSLKKLTTFFPDPSSSLSGYDIFVKMHRVLNSPGAQRGASLLPWHRELLWRFSNALRRHGYTGELPYWDSALDSELPDPSCSALWTRDQLGVSRGVVREPFLLWQPVVECGTQLSRKTLKGGKGRKLLFTKKKIEQVLAKACYSDLTWGWDRDFESYYNDVHAFFGPMKEAQMADPNCAPTDPAFWLHIAYIDLIWEKYRMYEQHEKTRETEYPKNKLGKLPAAMAWYSDMRPFGTNPNIQGLSDFYTRYYYSYEDHPSFIECKSDKDCHRDNTRLLWCDTKRKRCVAKMQLEIVSTADSPVPKTNTERRCLMLEVECGEGCACNQAWPDRQCWCPREKDTPKCKDCVCKCKRA